LFANDHPDNSSPCSGVIISIGNGYFTYDELFFQRIFSAEYRHCRETPSAACGRIPDPGVIVIVLVDGSIEIGARNVVPESPPEIRLVGSVMMIAMLGILIKDY
jgi:hypothetical protein